MVAHPRLGFVIDALFDLADRPDDRAAKIRLALLHREGACWCSSCGEDVSLAGFRRTKTSYAVRDEYRCGGCDQRFLLAEEQVC